MRTASSQGSFWNLEFIPFPLSLPCLATPKMLTPSSADIFLVDFCPLASSHPLPLFQTFLQSSQVGASGLSLALGHVLFSLPRHAYPYVAPSGKSQEFLSPLVGAKTLPLPDFFPSLAVFHFLVWVAIR